MPFLPRDFTVPASLTSDRFHMRPITIHDVVKDYDAVMTNRAHLWQQFGACWGWPPSDLTLEQDLIDLAWHQKEAQLRRAFDYAVMAPDESLLLGCFYVDPPTKHGFDADAYLWIRRDATAPDLEATVLQACRTWLADAWPFGRVAWPGRDIPWPDFDTLPER